jgi:hypothetical protein
MAEDLTSIVGRLVGGTDCYHLFDAGFGVGLLHGDL